ncbi:MAG: FAD:protein FMN transferase, partial [Planctomycetes bacterium]|nr:FAD:protein FMN transferase [Planctomycetota bacterium]
MNKRNYKIIIGIVFFAGLIALLNFCLPRKPVKSDSGYRLAMGTFARIVAIAPDANTARKAIEAAFEQIENIENLCSFYKSDSEVSEINRNAYDNPVVVSEITFEIIRKSIEFSRLSDGAFDITVGALEDLWRKAAKENLVPSQAALEKVRSKIGYEKIIIVPNDRSVSFAADGMKIDLGAIAKGFAIDKAIEAAKKIGALGAMVDIGGDIRCFGRPPAGKKFWQIGLQEPNPKS